MHCFRNLSVGLGLLFEHGTILSGSREIFDRFGPHVVIERVLNQKLSATLRYQHFDRTSNLAGGGYQLNVFTATLVYRL